MLKNPTNPKLPLAAGMQAALMEAGLGLGKESPKKQTRERMIELHTDQKYILDTSARFNVLDCGRRYGKTRFLVYLAAESAMEGFPVGWFAPDYKTLDDAWFEMKELLAPVTVHKDEQKYRIDLIGGGHIECWSLKNNPDAGRGRKYKRVLIDEAAKIARLMEAWTKSIRPTLTDYRGDAWFASTPRGIDAFKELYDRGQDEAYPQWMSWQRPTTANPHIDPDEIEEARGDLPEQVYAQEYLALFVDFSGAVFRNIHLVCSGISEPIDDEERKKHTYSVGVDWGRDNDFTVISVIDVCCRKEVYLERFNKIDYIFQLGRLRTVINHWHPQVFMPEANSMGAPLVELLEREFPQIIVPLWMSNPSKKYLVEGLSLAMDRLQIELLQDAVGTAELQAFESKRTPAGAYTYSAPSGMHDDTVIARMLAHAPLIDTAPVAGTFVADPEEDAEAAEYQPVAVF